MSRVLPLPLDVRLMNLTAALLVAGVALGAAAAALWWVLRDPMFAIGRISVAGDTAHSNAASLRASVAARVTGNFFTLDLAAAQAAFQSAPWVRRALVRREFPSTLRVALQEQVPAARWGQDAARLVNTYGEVFDAPGASPASTSALPRLLGPRQQSAQMLALYQLLAPQLKPLGTAMTELELLPRGDWRAQLEQGAVIELGRGTPEELAQRLRQFAATAREVAERHQRPLEAIEAADLRHAGGYALRLRGVTTVRSDAPLAASNHHE
jgi:cell division protein FtsQ